MKKKGLIISTIVMVIVLIASLTTATYAWFNQVSSTTLDGFNVSVVPGNVLKIGLRATSTGYDADAAETDFVNGNVVYTGAATAGKMYGGTWGGSGAIAGLGATLTHNVNFGSITKAVGYTSATAIGDASNDNTGTFASFADTGLVVKANAAAGTSDMGTAEAAVANGTTSGTAVIGDYAYFDLGVAPTKALAAGTNNLYVIVQTGDTYLGIGAAIHVAYRVNGGAWTDADVFTGSTYQTQGSTLTPAIPTGLTADVLSTGGITATGNAINGAGIVTIALAAEAANVLDQVEVIIYVAGADDDCIDKAINNGTYSIGLFFGAQEQAAA